MTSLLSAEGTADLVAGSEQASLNATTLGEFAEGEPVLGEGIPAGTTILGISGDT